MNPGESWTLIIILAELARKLTLWVAENQDKIGKGQTPDPNKIVPMPPINELSPSKSLKPVRKDKKEDRQTGTENWLNVFKNPTSVFTGLIAIFTILLVLNGRKQLRIARETSISQLRAYVSIESMKIENVIKNPVPERTIISQPRDIYMAFPSGGPSITIGIRNFGQTPAYNVLEFGEMFFENLYALSSRMPLRPKKEAEGTVCIPPGGIKIKTYNIPDPLGQDDIERLIDKTAAIFLKGCIKYRDAFGKSHFTNYCRWYNGSTGTVGQDAVCDEGNEAD